MGSDVWAVARERPVSILSERLIAQIKALAYDAEMLLRATAGQTGEAVAAARARTEASLRRAREDAAAASDAVIAGARMATVATDRYVRTNPGPAVAIALGVGFVIGRFCRRQQR